MEKSRLKVAGSHVLRFSRECMDPTAEMTIIAESAFLLEGTIMCDSGRVVIVE